MIAPAQGRALFKQVLQHANQLSTSIGVQPPFRHSAAQSTSALSRFDRATYAASSTQERQAVVLRFLTEQLVVVGGFTERDLDPAQGLLNLGLDSLMAIEWRNQINNMLDIRIPMSRLLEGQTLYSLTQFVMETLESQLLSQSNGAYQTPIPHPGDPSTTPPSPGSDIHLHALLPSSQGLTNQPYKKQRGKL